MHTLEEVVGAFESWRASRVRKNEPIPDRLWAITKALVPYYKKAHIQKALRLSGSQFNERCMTCDEQNTNVAPGDSFAVGTFCPQQCLHDEVCELTLNGIHKSLQIKINIQNIAPILSLVERYL